MHPLVAFYFAVIGAFGIVYGATLHRCNGDNTEAVAVKTIKGSILCSIRHTTV